MAQEICGDGLDNDSNGLFDCADGACSSDAGCADAFTCLPGFYAVHGTQLKELDFNTNTYIDIGTAHTHNIKALAYSVRDGFFYGLRSNTNELLRIGQSGVTSLGAVTGLPNQNYNAGDFGPDGLLYVKRSSSVNELYAIDVNGISATSLALSATLLSVTDMVYHQSTDRMYGIRDNVLYEIDLATGDLMDCTLTGDTENGGYGGLWATTDPMIIYAQNNSGEIYEVDLSACTQTSFETFSAPTANNGASCMLALSPFASTSGGPLSDGDLDDDGIPDNNDIDIDNDGIPNDIENNCGSPFDLNWADWQGTAIDAVTFDINEPIVEDGVTIDLSSDDPSSISGSDFETIKAQNIGGSTPVLYYSQDANTQAEFTDVWITFSEPLKDVSFTIVDIDFVSNGWADSLAILAYFQGNIYDLTSTEVSLANPASVAFNDALNSLIGLGNNNPQSNNNGNATLSFNNPIDSLCIRYGNGPNAPINPAPQIIGISGFTGETLCDTDMDGIPDMYDPDSDNDNCLDAIESGSGYTIQADSTVTGPYGTNGLADALEDPDDSGILIYTPSDNGSIFDFQNNAVDNCDTEICGNGFDDDNDGDVDCDDSDCSPLINSVTSVDPICPNLNSGSITIDATFTGAGAIEYSIDNGSNYQSSNVFNNLIPGSYTIVVQTESGSCATVYVSNPVNLIDPGCGTAPDANTDNENAIEDEGPYIFDPQENDTDAEGDPLTTTIISGPTSGGSVSVLNGDSISYSPGLNFCGIDTIVYQICDPILCDIDTIFIDVACVQDAPDGGNENVSTNEDTPLGGIDLDDNNNEPDGDPITIIVPAGSGQGGTVSSNGDGTVDYIPPPEYNGADTVIYLVCDDQIPPNCVSDTLFIDVLPVNDIPVVTGANGSPAINDTVTVNTVLDTPILICPDASDADGDLIDVTAATLSPNNGILSGLSDGDTCFTYTPDLGFLGMDTVTVIICDPTPECDTLTVIINVIPNNGTPDANTDNVTVDEDSDSNVIDVQDNDTDPEGDPLTTDILSGPSSGGTAVVINGDSILYAPGPDFCGTDTIIYQVCDMFSCDIDTVFIEVICIQDPPDQGNETVSTNEDTPLDDIDLDDNNIDPDGDPVTVTSPGVTSQGGTIIDNGDGTIDYIPPPDYNGADTLIYEVCDDQIPPNCVTDTLFIDVLPVNDVPDGTGVNGIPTSNDTINVVTGQDIPIELCANVIDIDGDPVDITSVILSPSNGSLSGIADGDSCFTYTPDLGFLGFDTTTVIICDPGLLCDTLTIIINVVPPIDTDGDGILDTVDLDDDNDGIPDTVEEATASNGGDTDNDGIPDSLDLDSDNDGIPDIVESGGIDTDGDGIVDDQLDADRDGIPDAVDVDFTLGTDANMDGIDDSAQGGTDSDGDGIQDTDDPDANGDGMDDDDNVQNPVDFDGDGTPDFQDLDSDNDGLNDVIEANDGDASIDPDGDGMIGTGAIFDNDFDGFADVVDTDDNTTAAPGDGFGNPLPSPDSDGDGTPDHNDLDSDNDGIPDEIEGDIDGDGEPDDWDNDGVPNYQDLDSDNDGISDVVESGGDDPDGNGIVGSGAITDADGDGLEDSIDNDPNDGINLNNENLVDSTSLLWDNDANGSNEDDNDTDQDGNPDYLDLDSDNDGLPDIIEAGGTDMNADGQVDGFEDMNGDGWDDNGSIPFPEDTDGDGVPDHQDLDSDNDGINDIIEINGGDTSVDSDNDGMIDDFSDPNGNGWDELNEINPPDNPDTDGDGISDHEDLDSDNDGILDDWENDPNEDGSGPDDFDGDGVPDYLDLDSDNDTMPDVVEAGGVDEDGDGTIDNYNDGNGDGADDDDIQTDPDDTDMDGAPDHNDIDSDNDGITDIIEANSGDDTLDTDGDGMVDIFIDDNGDGWVDDIGVSDPPDFDGDGESDYTDLDSDDDGISDEDEYDVNGDGDGPDDSDGDGAPNYIDFDSDNDGIVDMEEYDPNGDGIPDDCDNDDIPDWLDPDDCNIGLIIPQGFSPNGDLNNDIWVIDGLENFPNNQVYIFNRWGTPLGEFSPYQNDWDGTYDGKALPTGTYYYMLYTEPGSEPISGWVYIIND
ncbi:MAG: Ig-like domain-containing protein [Bacteroidota bacterium]